MASKLSLKYWPLAGRGEFVRILLVEAGVDFNEENDVDLMVKLFKTNEQEQHFDFHHYAPPLISDG